MTSGAGLAALDETRLDAERLSSNIEGRQSGITIAPQVDGRSTMFAVERLAQAPGWVIFVGRTREAQLALATTLLSWVLAAMVALAVGVGVLASAHRREALRLSRQEAAALRAGRAEIERLLGGLPVVIFLRAVAPDGSARLLYRNGDIETVTGWPTALLRDLEDWSDYCLPSWSSEAFLLSTIQQETTSTDWQMLQPDGGLRSMRTHTRRLSLQPDGSFEVVGYLLDVSVELKAAAQAAAAGRLASLGEMAAGIAHELKQPLQSISLLAENALVTLERGGTDRVAERLHRVVQRTEHAADIIENLRRFARGTPDDAPPVPVELAHVVQQTLALAEDALRGASVTLQVELGDPAPIVMGHAVGIQQTLLNLVLNARDAMAQQPGDMPRSIRIWTERRPEGWVALKVVDSGGGIPLPVLARIFEPFVTTKGPDKGTGLGLSISYGLIRAMGGTIEAHNVGGGAEFTITLPAAPEGHA
ncbi:MAG: ATP-binding protein [Roseococcus sp.]